MQELAWKYRDFVEEIQGFGMKKKQSLVEEMQGFGMERGQDL